MMDGTHIPPEPWYQCPHCGSTLDAHVAMMSGEMTPDEVHGCLTVCVDCIEIIQFWIAPRDPPDQDDPNQDAPYDPQRAYLTVRPATMEILEEVYGMSGGWRLKDAIYQLRRRLRANRGRRH